MLKTTLLQIVITLLLPFLFVDSAQSAEIQELRFVPVDKKRDRDVPVKIYLGKSNGPQPVVMFSHGLGGSRENNEYLGKHWAAAGFVAVFMQHHGSDSDVWKKAKVGERFTKLKAAASFKSSQDRLEDVPFVIDQLELWNKQSGHPLKGKLDLDHIGMSGHSFGAVTTLGVAGRKYAFNRSYPEPRIDAFIAYSPNTAKGMPPERTFGHLKQPILCMTGTKDASPIDPTMKPEDRQKVYAALPKGDKYQLVLDGGEHMAFGDSKGFRTRGRNPKHHPAIQEISLHFWKAYLQDDEKSKQWLQSNNAITSTGLSDADVWEWK